MKPEHKLEKAYNLLCEAERELNLSGRSKTNLKASRCNLETLIDVERD